MKQIFPDMWQWSWFSDEKQLNFNGLLLTIGEHTMLVDPPPMTSEARDVVRRHEPIDYIVLTNRDHVREAPTYQAEWKCQLYVPEADAAQMEVNPTRTYKDGELLPGGIWVIHLKDQKSPGESALFIERGRGVLIVGDALIGRPAGALCLLPPEKYADPVKAKEALQRLLRYHFDSLLVGDGVSILTEAKQQVKQLLAVPR
jgi:glyoxylase-like metal-dependent hydrolase (beta-lactamase superfamily II)